MSKRKINIAQRVRRFGAAFAVALFPSLLATEGASAAVADETTPSTMPIPPLLPTIPPTTSTTTIPVPVTFPPSPSTTAYPDPDPNAKPDTGVGVELPTTTTSSTTTTTMRPTTTTSTTSTTTTTIPVTTTTSTVPVATSTTITVPATTTTAAPITTTSAAPVNTTTTMPAPSTTVAPVIVTTTTVPQPALAVTGSNDTKPLSLMAGVAVAAGFGLVFATGNGKGRRPAFATDSASENPSATTRSTIRIDSPYSNRSAVSLSNDPSSLPAPTGAPAKIESLRVVRTPNVPAEVVVEVEVSPAPGIEIPEVLAVEAASEAAITAPSRQAFRDARKFRAPSRDAFRAARAAEQASYAVVSLDELNASRVVGINAIAL